MRHLKHRLPLAPVLTPIACENGCGECCGPVPVTRGELAKVRVYIEAHGIVPVAQGTRCPLYIRGGCAIYPIRPRVCQAYGHSERLACSRGHNAWVDDEAALQKWVIGGGIPGTTLHELVGEVHDVPRMLGLVR